MYLKIVYSTLVLLFVSGAVNAGNITLYPDRDATLIEHPHGERANGTGPSLFIGRTSQNVGSIRRTLLRFDITGALPKNAIIENVSLVLYMAKSNSQAVDITVHRVLDDWQEGPSSSSGGGGAPSQAGDITWLHTSYDVAYWNHIGGHFVTRPSATTNVGASGVYSWQNYNTMLADVRLWLKAPQRNFGWLLMGDETQRQNVKRFYSRESTSNAKRPALIIHYRLPGKK